MKVSYRLEGADTPLHVSYAPTGLAWSFDIGAEKLVARVSSSEALNETAERVTIEIDGITSTHTVSVAPVYGGQENCVWVNNPAGQIDLIALPKFPIASLAAVAGGPTAPVPGRVVAVNVAPGEAVVAGQVLVIMEAMKMEHKIIAAADATIAEVRCVVGDQVGARQVLVTFTE